jgi:hypothetical protein
VVAVLAERAARAGVTTLLAHTLAEENPSTAVLRRSGFEVTEALEDPDVGGVWRWERPLAGG